MSTHAVPGETVETAPADGSLTRALAHWLAADSPLRFAMRHLLLAAVFLSFGLAAAVLLRIELLTPRLDLMSARTFGALLSLHGGLLFYFVWVPAFPAVLGYAFLPRLLGATRLAYPPLMIAAWGLLLFGGVLTVNGFLGGGTDAGWTFDARFGGRFTSPGVLAMALGVSAAALALALMGVNLVGTIARGRGATVSASALPTLVALLCAGLTAVVAGIELACCALLVAVDGLLGVAIFDPARGGDPLLFKALSRFAFSAAQSMMLLTGLGVVIAVIRERTRPRAGADRPLGFAVSIAVSALAGLAAWPATEADPVRSQLSQQLHFGVYAVAASATMSALVRSVAMLRHGVSRIDTALVYALAFLTTMTVMLCTGAVLTLPRLGALLGSTTFATAHFHVTAMALAMAFLAGLHDAWPRLARRRVSESLGIAAALVLVAGTCLTFLPLFVLGVAGASFRANSYPPEFQVLQVLSTGGMTVLLAGLVLAVLNLAAGRRTGVRVSGLAPLDGA